MITDVMARIIQAQLDQDTDSTGQIRYPDTFGQRAMQAVVAAELTCLGFGGHCFRDDDIQVNHTVHPPEGGWPVRQTCKHCGRRRVRKIVYEEQEDPQ